MQKHQIHITDIQPIQTGLNKPLRIRHFRAGIDFCGHKNFLPLDPLLCHGLPDRPAHLRLVSVSRGRIDQADAAFQRGLDGIHTGIAVKAVGSQPVYWHGIAAVQQHGSRFQIKAARFISGGSRRLGLFLLSGRRRRRFRLQITIQHNAQLPSGNGGFGDKMVLSPPADDPLLSGPAYRLRRPG